MKDSQEEGDDKKGTKLAYIESSPSHDLHTPCSSSFRASSYPRPSSPSNAIEDDWRSSLLDRLIKGLSLIALKTFYIFID
ncbi:hypothetical protein Hanom_Chr15g01375891 [Helianthus anomalus]